jgi:two-component system, NarL family, response regulator LiaR
MMESKSKNQCGPALMTRSPVRVAMVDSDLRLFEALRECVGARGLRWAMTWHGDSTQAVQCIAAHKPDAVLMEIDMPRLCGIRCAERLRLLAPELRIVMHTARGDPVAVFNSLAVGARGYLVKPTGPEEIVDAVGRALESAYVFNRQAEEVIFGGLGRMAELAKRHLFSKREMEVLAYLWQGLSDKDISVRMGICNGTVHRHLSIIYNKMDVHTRQEAVRAFFASTMAAGGSDGRTGRSCFNCCGRHETELVPRPLRQAEG